MEVVAGLCVVHAPFFHFPDTPYLAALLGGGIFPLVERAMGCNARVLASGMLPRLASAGGSEYAPA